MARSDIKIDMGANKLIAALNRHSEVMEAYIADKHPERMAPGVCNLCGKEGRLEFVVEGRAKGWWCVNGHKWERYD